MTADAAPVLSFTKVLKDNIVAWCSRVSPPQPGDHLEVTRCGVVPPGGPGPTYAPGGSPLQGTPKEEV
jgi:hypothetical protein